MFFFIKVSLIYNIEVVLRNHYSPWLSMNSHFMKIDTVINYLHVWIPWASQSLNSVPIKLKILTTHSNKCSFLIGVISNAYKVCCTLYLKRMLTIKWNTYIFSGAVCKLYFDLEFSIPDNPDNNGTEMVAIFIQVGLLWILNNWISSHIFRF